jgi:hypothetical protein
MIDRERDFAEHAEKGAEAIKKAIGFSKATGAAKLKVNSFTASNNARRLYMQNVYTKRIYF